MKKVDYYAINQPWKMPKWLGATIGGVFGLIAVTSVALIVQLTKSPEAPKPAIAELAAPAAAPVDATATPARPESVEKPVAITRAERVTSSRSHHGKRHAKHAKPTRLASAKRSIGLTDSRAQAILARHESKSQRRDKDALDRMLGL